MEQSFKRTEANDPEREPDRSGTHTAAWLAWALWTLCVALFMLTLLLTSLTPETPVKGWLPAVTMVVGGLWLSYPTVGALIVSHQPKNLIGWIFCVAGFMFTAAICIGAYADYSVFAHHTLLPATLYAAWVSDSGVGFIISIATTVLILLLFPTGHPPSRRWWPVAWAAIVGSALVALTSITWPGSMYLYPSLSNPFGLEGRSGETMLALGRFGLFITMVALVASWLSLLVRWEQAELEVRQQLRWFTVSAAPMIVVIMVAYWSWGVGVAAFLPIAAGIAIFKHRLYDIDVIINRTLVYGSLTVCVVGLYVLVVGAIGVLLQSSDNLLVSLLATGFVALLFQPLRVRLQRGVNRLMYGHREEPYSVLSRLGRRLEGTLVPEEALSTIVETVTQALKLPYAAIELSRGGGFTKAAESGTPAAEHTTLPLIYQSEEVGRLIVDPQTPGQEFASTDRQLLDDIAHHAGATAYAARLTNDLQRSREQLVTAREEERRRLRRDLHDGLGPTLGALTLGLDTARSMVKEKPDAEELLTWLKEESQEAVTDVRRLVYGLRPPALDDLGLVAAIRQQAAKHGSIAEGPDGESADDGVKENGLVFYIETAASEPSWPAAVEVAAYRIAQEAITNVARHANASSCSIRLSNDEKARTLELQITDDGTGIPMDRRVGVGMGSMRERAEELGGTLRIEAPQQGGKRVIARLPLPEKEE